MTCNAKIVYWEPGAEACDWCLDAEGYYAVDDCPDAHDLCQCILVELDVSEDQIEFENFQESSAEYEETYDYVFEGHSLISPFATDYSPNVFWLFREYRSDFYWEYFNDECFRDYCQLTSGSWTYDDELDASDYYITVPPGYDWEGEMTFTVEEVEYSADATSTVDTGETSEFVALGPVNGFRYRLIDVEFGEGELVKH